MKVSRLIVSAMAAFLGASSATAAVLATEQFVIVIVERCPEGDVACNDVSYTGINRKTGEAISLKGQAWVRMCADAVTPCEHVGWQFKNGEFTYRVRETPPSLEVERGGKTLIDQKAVWLEY